MTQDDFDLCEACVMKEPKRIDEYEKISAGGLDLSGMTTGWASWLAQDSVKGV